MLVSNTRHTGNKTCRCGSWLEHWARFGGCTTLAICSANSCYKIATVGTPIAVHGKSLVVPMCDHHNQLSYPVDVYDSTLAVSADEARTCARPSLADLGLASLADLPPHRFQAPLDVAGMLSTHFPDQPGPDDNAGEVAGFLVKPHAKRNAGG